VTIPFHRAPATPPRNLPLAADALRIGGDFLKFPAIAPRRSPKPFKISMLRPPLLYRLLSATALGLMLTLAAPAQIVLTGELLTNPGAESGLTGWNIRTGVGYLADNGTYDPGYNPHSGSAQFVAGLSAGATGSLGQTVSLSALSSTMLDRIDAGEVSAAVSLWVNILFQGGFPDYQRITLTYWDGSAGLLGTVSTPDLNSAYSGGSLWQNYSGSFAVPTGTRAITYTIDSFRGINGGSWIDAFSDDHSLTLTAVPEPATVAAALGFAALGLVALHRRSRARSHGSPPRPNLP